MSEMRRHDADLLSDAQRFDWLRLWRSESVGPRTFRALINRFGNARAALEVLPAVARRPLRIPSEAEIEAEFEAARRCGASFVGLGEPAYPPLLRRIHSAPAIISLRGDSAIFARPAVAIVGSRNGSAAGLTFAERLAKGLAQHGYAVVSGVARGIDIRAHRATAESGTIVVLAAGQDKIYPPEFAPLVENFVEHGAVISEMPFGWEARGRDFPRRNRIVARLAQGTIVVEAARRSGSLITARFATEQGREVFAVPGSPLDPRAEGTNDLLREGATLCTCVEDVLECLTRQIDTGLLLRDRLAESGLADPDGEPLWDELALSDVKPAPAAPRDAGGLARETTDASPDEAKTRILALLGPSPISIDELVRSAAAPARDVRTVLFELELAGRIERHGGDLVSLI